jgi:serine/threonine protein kinase
MYCSSHYIGRYYFSSQQEQKEKLFVDYYPAASMQRYRQKHSLCFSLLSKLYLLSQACNGLRFLHDNKIYHLNFQLKNVMMGKGFLTRIIGFERALHPTV